MNFNYVTNSMHHKMRQYFHRTSVWTFLNWWFGHSRDNIKIYLTILYYWVLKTAYFISTQELVMKPKRFRS